MRHRIILTAACLSGFTTISLAQEFDAQAFENAVNEEIRNMPGVSFTTTGDFKPAETVDQSADIMKQLGISKDWALNAVENAPNFGFVVSNAQGSPVDVIGGEVPFQTVDNKIEITGYDLPDGWNIKTVGTAGYIGAVSEIAQIVQAPSSDVENAVKTVKAASAYLFQELCSDVARPTEITLNLTAGFELVFNVETGSQFHWDMEIVCLR